MPTLDADDLADMFEDQDVGTYSSKAFAGTHPSANSSTVNGVFLKDFITIGEVESFAPVFDCATTDVSDASHGAKLTVHPNGIVAGGDLVYTVRGVEADGEGITRLILEAP